MLTKKGGRADIMSEKRLEKLDVHMAFFNISLDDLGGWRLKLSPETDGQIDKYENRRRCHIDI